VKQGKDQDPEGRFTRRWVPELAQLPTAVLQRPWPASGADVADHPRPIVDPVTAARTAKDRLTALRRTPGYREAALAVFEKHGSRARRFENDNPRSARVARRIPATSSDQLKLPFDEEG
jgi:deoxyribodipyrimidine photo-lyase